MRRWVKVLVWIILISTAPELLRQAIWIVASVLG
jgi:hypothetical protein